MKHIVFLVGSYYPNYSAVGKCLGNIADILEDDFNITVISMKTQCDQSGEEILRKQKIIRITTKYHDKRMKNDEALKRSFGAAFKKQKFVKCCLRVEKLLRTVCSPSTLEQTWVKRYLSALQSIETPIDILIPTCIPFESIVASMEYKRRNPGAELLPYLFDLFADNKNLNRFYLNLLLKKKQNMKLERQMLEESKKVFHVLNWSAYLKKEFPEYKNKTIEVEHPLLMMKERQGDSLTDIDRKIHVVYTGVLDVKNRNPQFALEVLSKIQDNVAVDFYSFGSGNAILEKAVEKSGGKIISHGRVSSEESEKARAQGNILLSIGNSDVSQIPSKLFEYMSSGKAILHIAVSLQDPAIKVLEKYPAKLVLIKGEEYEISKVNDFIEQHQDTILPFDEIARDYYMAYPPYISDKVKQIIESSETGGGYKLVFAGSLLRGYVEASYVLQLFTEVHMNKFYITFYSAGNASVDVEKVQNERITLAGWVSKEKLDDAYILADGFISISEKEGKQISSKIFEYMSWGKPIIHFYFSDKDENLKYLKEYPNALCLKASIDCMEQNRRLLRIFMKYRRDVQVMTLKQKCLKCCTPQYIAFLLKLECCK